MAKPDSYAKIIYDLSKRGEKEELEAEFATTVIRRVKAVIETITVTLTAIARGGTYTTLPSSGTPATVDLDTGGLYIYADYCKPSTNAESGNVSSATTGFWADEMEMTVNRMNAGLMQQGVEGDKPAAGYAGRWWFSTDTGLTWRDSGAAWVQVLFNDPAVATVGLRSLGTGAQQAAAGNHTHGL